MPIGNQLRKLRKEKGYTREQLAKETGLTLAALGNYERNEREPNFEAMAKLEKYFGVTAGFLKGETDINYYDTVGKDLNKTLSAFSSELLNLKDILENMPREEQLEASAFLDISAKILTNESITEKNLFDYLDIINGILSELHRFILNLGKINANKSALPGSIIKKYMRSLSRSMSDLAALYGFKPYENIYLEEKSQDLQVPSVKDREAVYLPVFNIKMLDDASYRTRNDIASEDRVLLPVKGDAAAGKPIEIVEFNQESVPADKKYANYNSFLVRVRGDSMINAGINNGDYVIVRPQPIVENGEIALINIDGNATIKFFHMTNSGYELRSANPSYQPMHYGSKDDVRILGKVVNVIPKNVAISSLVNR